MLAVLALASPAHAKGPSEGVIEGESLSAPIVISGGEGTSGGMAIIEDVGFFPAAFRSTPDPMLDQAPTSDLGPRFTLRWKVPGPTERVDEIVQVLYPYAAGGPLVFTEPGQPFFEAERTRGGWFVAPASLTTRLQGLGIPREATPSGSAAGTNGPADRRSADGSSGGGSSSTLPIGATLGGVIVLALALALVARRRAAPASTT